MAMPMKSAKCRSMTGLAPAMAAPTPAPTSAVSEIGVSSTRSGNSSFMPANWPKMPPCLAMSSP